MKQTQKTILISIYLFFIYMMFYLPVNAAGLLKPANSSTQDKIAIKSHKVNVTINNGFSKTEVDQIFINTGDKDLEATYSFPVPKNASLSELSLWIDGKEAIGEVLEKEKAKKTYEEQKAKGNNTAIAEKNDYKTFDVSVSPVRAGKETRVRIVYYQPLEIDLNIGRYVYPLEEGNVDDDRISFWETDNKIKETFSFNAVLKSAFPVKDIRVPGFQNQAVVKKHSPNTDSGSTEAYEIDLKLNEGAELSKDIVLYYRLDDTIPARVELIPFREKDAKQGKFMVVITPGSDLGPIQNGTDWIFVLDTSGSMGGNKISTLVKGVKKTIKRMSPDHRFKIISFNNNAREITNGFLHATRENINHASGLLDSVNADGGTNLYEGIEQAYSGLDADRTTGIIIVTDGVANVGQHKHSQLVELHKKYDYRLFTFIIGNSANQPLLETLAKESGGFAMNISSNDDLIGRVMQAKIKMAHKSLYNTKVKFSGEQIQHLTPSDIGNVYIGQQIVLFGSYTSPGQTRIKLSGRIDGQNREWTTIADLPDIDTDNPEIERLWAMSSIDETMEQIRQKGESKALVNKTINLGTQYSLVSDYTSMVVLKDVEMESMGIPRNNASRVQKERAAQQRKASAPVKNYNVAQKNNSTPPMFGNQRSPGIGTGAVGPLFIGLACLLRRFRSEKCNINKTK